MKITTIFLLTLLSFSLQAQVFSYVSVKDGEEITHRIIMDEQYFIETQFSTSPPKFVLTRGGFYTQKGQAIEVSLEFNSNFEKDGIKNLEILLSSNWKLISKSPIDLNGKWLMAGRVTDDGENRRNITAPRKTMKFLKDGYFQWIAFNTETFQFFGSGGGFYTAENQKYTEHIEYFSRNNETVGKVLPFSYNLKTSDWYHSGMSSKGELMREIWTKRMDNPHQ
ncbi:MAG: hypothetical protein VW262_08140 [Flavobacteriaceae bacterium]|jgi:hypothetical protein